MLLNKCSHTISEPSLYRSLLILDNRVYVHAACLIHVYGGSPICFGDSKPYYLNILNIPDHLDNTTKRGR